MMVKATRRGLEPGSAKSVGTTMKNAEIERDLAFLDVPLDEVPENKTFEIRLGGPDWKRGFRYGKLWLHDGDLVGRVSETTAVRFPASWVDDAIDSLVETIQWGWESEDSKADIQDALDDKLDNWCHDLIWPRGDDGKLDPATFARVRRMLCLAAFQKADPRKPLSEIVAGYHVLNAANEVVFETTSSVCACDHAFNVTGTGFAGVGVVFADGSVRYNDELARVSWLPWPKPGRAPRAAKRKPPKSRTPSRSKSKAT